MELSKDELYVLYALDKSVSLDEAQIASEALLPPSELEQALQALVRKGYAIMRPKEGHSRYVRSEQAFDLIVMK